MTDKLIGGDYAVCADRKALVQCDGTEELLQAARVLLQTARGRFYPNKDFGSLIGTITLAPRAAYLEAYARQALDSLDGVYVKSAVYDGTVPVITLTVNDEEGVVRLSS